MTKITKTGQKGIDLIKQFEGFSAKPYLCPAKIPTIGFGATFYPDGKKVTMNDKLITESQGVDLLRDMLNSFEKYVDSYCIDTINQNQFDALVSFCYNVGPANLKSSTLLKKVNANPNDPTIKDEFLKWTKAGGKVLKGLVTRRTAEANLYFTPVK
jgi:lysozyme